MLNDATHHSDPASDRDDADAEVATYTEEELQRLLGRVNRLDERGAAVRKKLGHKNSKRGKRRALALFIGHENAEGRIWVSDLRWACTRHDLYTTRSDRANFTMDMRKDCDRGFFEDHTYKGRRRRLSGYWSLTEKGARLAAEYAEAVGADTAARRKRLIETHRGVASTIKITKTTARCPFCREDIEGDTDKAVCGDCGNGTHATCLIEFRRRASRHCVLASTTAQCRGNYVVKAIPGEESDYAPRGIDCDTCHDMGWIYQGGSAVDCPDCSAPEPEPTPPAPEPTEPEEAPSESSGGLTINILASRTVNPTWTIEVEGDERVRISGPDIEAALRDWVGDNGAGITMLGSLGGYPRYRLTHENGDTTVTVLGS